MNKRCSKLEIQIEHVQGRVQALLEEIYHFQ